MTSVASIATACVPAKAVIARSDMTIRVVAIATHTVATGPKSAPRPQGKQHRTGDNRQGNAHSDRNFKKRHPAKDPWFHV